MRFTASILPLIFLFSLWAEVSLAYEDEQLKSPEARLSALKEKRIETNKNSEAIALYFKEADIYIDYFNDFYTADSLMRKAIEMAEISRNDVTIKEAHYDYLKSAELGNESEFLHESIERLTELSDDPEAPDENFKYWRIICNACQVLGKECGPSFADKMFLYAAVSGDIKEKVLANMAKGGCAKDRGEWELAYSYYASADLLILEMKEPQRVGYQFDLDGAMALYFEAIEDYNSALEYRKEQEEIILGRESVDSTALMWLRLEELFSMNALGEYSPIKGNLNKIIRYADRHHLARLKDWAFSFYRKFLIEQQDLEGFSELYENRYPQLLEDMRENNQYDYFTVRAYLNEFHGRLDSAYQHWKTARQMVSEDGNLTRIIHINNRIAQFFVRSGQLAKARDLLEETFILTDEISSASARVDYKQDLSGLLEDIYFDLEDYKSSKIFTDLYYEYSGIIAKRFPRSIIKQQSVHEENRRTKLEQLEAYKKKRLHNLQYLIIVVLIIILFLGLVVVSSMTVPAWLIEMFAFFSILAIMEFIILLLDKQVQYWTGGEPLQKFFIKMAVLSLLFPLHHVVEQKVTDYMKKHRLIGKPSWKDFKKAMASLWPWLDDQNEHQH